MKKYLWIVALLVALSLVFIGCPDKDKEPPDGDKGWTSTYSPSSITLEQNLYSDGYQAHIQNAALFSGRKVLKGDEYTLDIEFTVSRAVPDGIKIGLVDTVTDYWNPLTWNGADDAPDEEKMYGTGELVVGETYSKKVVMTALKDSPQAGPTYNSLVFQTEKEYERIKADENKAFTTTDSNGGPIPGDVTITFTKFVFMKGDGGGETPPETLPPEPEVVPEITVDATAGTATHDNFKFVVSTSNTQGSWDGDEEGDNSFVIRSGAIRYLFPSTDTFKASDYDFVKVEYEATTVKDIVLKEYATGVDNVPFAGGITEGGESVTFEIRYCVGGGFAIQKWSAATVEPATEITITGVTFIKGTRYAITFDPDAEGVTAPTSPAFFVKDTKVGALPSLTREGFIHTGWTKGGTAVTSNMDVDASFADATLTATWEAFTPRNPQTVTFTAGMLSVEGGGGSSVKTVSVVESGAGYTFEYSNGYGNAYAMFVYNFSTAETGAKLADFDKVTFTYKSVQGDANQKAVHLAASATAFSGYLNLSTDANSYGSIASEDATGAAGVTLTLNIDKGKAAALGTGPLYLSFFIFGGPATDTPSDTTIFQITNVTFSQNTAP